LSFYKRSLLQLAIGGVMLSAAIEAVAQEPALDAVIKAVNNNPEVLQQWYELKSVEAELDQASAAYKPNLDISSEYNYNRRDYSFNREYDGARADVQLTQVLFDGFQALNVIERFEQIKLVRYYEFRTVAENVGYAALEVYLDVLRYRYLVNLARENVEQHEKVYEQIRESAQAGVARNADLEQITGRLALAKSNLLTQQSNLHDVTSRYIRIVGELPPKQMPNANLNKLTLPNDIRAAIRLANRHNPELKAALRDIEAKQQQIEESKGAYYPQLQLVASHGVSELDNNGFDNSQYDTQVGIQMSMNLYSGGRDYATTRRNVAQLNSAQQRRDVVCRNIHQTLLIEINALRNLSEQLPALEQHKLSSSKVRTAYKDQFDIGQRSLLDVLDAENEYYEASIALIESKFAIKAGKAQLLASIGELLNQLTNTGEFKGFERDSSEPLQVNPDFACPATDVTNAYYADYHWVE